MKWRSVVIGLAVLLAGCAATPAPKSQDSVEAILAASEDWVRAAVVQVLEKQGYTVTRTGQEAGVLRTGYRREIAGPWDWLLRSRFGVGRSRVEVMIAPETQQETHLVILIPYEGKDGLMASWRPYETPLPQSAANSLRLLRNTLGLLD